jgi:hypothetical protein
MVAFDSIDLRNADRAILLGGTQSGKSTLAAGSLDYAFPNTLCGQYLARYPNAQLLIADTKPRFRAAYQLTGMSDSRHYKDWRHGPAVPDSTRIDPWDIRGLERALNTCRIAIVQTDSIDRDAPGVAAIIEHFRKGVGRKHKRMVFIDELMDFYTSNGTPMRGCGNIILRCARAGAERDLTSLFGSQRAKGISPQLWELINKFYLFRMDLLTDLDRMHSAGIPRSMVPPEEDYRFRYWTKLERLQVYGPYSLTMNN